MNSATHDPARTWAGSAGLGPTSPGEELAPPEAIPTETGTVASGRRGLAATSAGVVADPDTLRRAAAALSAHGESLGVAPIDRRLLSADSVGHPGLAQAVQDFVEVWEQRLAEFGGHLAGLSTAVGHAAQRYRDTDHAAAENLVHFDPTHGADAGTTTARTR